MSSWRVLAPIALVGAVLVALSWATRESRAPQAVAASVADAPFAATLWPAGTKRTYRSAFHSETRIGLRNTAAGTLGGTVDLEGDLAIVSHGKKENGLLTLSFSWVTMRRAEVAALEHTLTGGGDPAATAATAATAVVEVEPDGRLVTLGFARGTPALARLVERSVTTEILAVIEGALGTRADVRTSSGRASVERASGNFFRTGYVELDAIGPPKSVDAESLGKVTRDASGAVVTAEHAEKVSAEADDEHHVEGVDLTTRLELALIRTELDETARRSLPADVELVSTATSTESQRAASLARRSEGVTAATVKEDLRMASLFPRAGETSWMWRDSAWLELNPHASAELLAYAEKELGAIGLAAAVDLVVVSGTASGQTSLLALLQRKEKDHGDGVFEMVVQHVEHLRAPRPEIFAFVTRAYASAGGIDAPSPRKGACAYALGAMARRSLELRPKAPLLGERPACTEGANGDCSADVAVARLERELGETRTERGREILLRALGNAGQSSSFSRVAPHARSTSADVRRATAAAMRNMQGSAVVDALLVLCSDSDASVASEAFQSLFRKELDDADLETIERLVTEGRVPQEAHATLIDGLVVQRETHPLANGILLALLGSEHASARDKMKIESILRRG